MPSPLAHVAVGIAIGRVWPRRGADWSRVPLMATCAALSMLPDLDAVPGLVLGNLAQYHNHFAASPAFGTAVALLAALIAAIVRPGARARSARRAFLLTFACYQTHLAMDFMTVSRGTMLFWPISETRYAPPFHLFYGLRWSDGLVSARHLITLASEVAFIALLAFTLHLAPRRGGPRRCSPSDSSTASPQP